MSTPVGGAGRQSPDRDDRRYVRRSYLCSQYAGTVLYSMLKLFYFEHTVIKRAGLFVSAWHVCATCWLRDGVSAWFGDHHELPASCVDGGVIVT